MSATLPPYPVQVTVNQSPSTLVGHTGQTPREITVSDSADNAPWRLLLGRVRTPHQFAWMGPIGSRYAVVSFWGIGEIGGVRKMYLDGQAAPADIIFTHYTGRTDQPVDQTLAVAIPGFNSNMVWDYRGGQLAMSYTVSLIPRAYINGIPRLEAELDGLLFADPRDATISASRNAGVVMGGVLGNSLWGAGWNINAQSHKTLADFNDEILGDTPRNQIGLVVSRPMQAEALAEELRAVAGALIVRDGDEVHLVPYRDDPASDVITSNQVKDHQPAVAGDARTPTVVRVTYTDISGSTWRLRPSEPAIHPDVLTGKLDWIEDNVRREGIQNHPQAYRAALELLNHYWLSDLSGSFVTKDSGIRYRLGQVVELTTPDGLLTNKLVRLIYCDPTRAGRYRVSYEEHDPAQFSNAVVTQPTYGDTSLPDPRDIPKVTDLGAAEEFFPLGGGIYASVFRVTFASDDYQYQHTWEYSVRQAGTQIWQGPLSSTEFLSGIVERGRNYEIAVRIVGFSGLTGAWETVFKQAKGIELPPSDVDGFSVDEYGGEVYAAWKPGIDVVGDRIETEWRYGPVGCTWDTSRFINRARGFTDSTKQIPHGEWDFLARHIDSFENYSENVARVTRKVTLDSAAWLVERRAISVPVLVNMVATYRVPGEIEYQTDLGQPWVTRFANGLDTYPLPMPSYQAASGTVSWSSEIVDMELSLAGTWEGHIPGLEVVTSSDPAVTTTITLRVTDDDPAGSPVWTVLDQVDLTAEPNRRLVGSGQGRYAQLIAETYHETTDTQPSYFIITTPDTEGPDSPYIRIDAIPAQERHAFVSHATNPVTITLNTPAARLQGVEVASIDAGNLRTAVKWDVDSLGNPTQLGLHVVNTTTGKKIGGIDTEIIVKFIPLESA